MGWSTMENSRGEGWDNDAERPIIWNMVFWKASLKKGHLSKDPRVGERMRYVDIWGKGILDTENKVFFLKIKKKK